MRSHLVRLLVMLLIVMTITGMSAMAFASDRTRHTSRTQSSGHIEFTDLIAPDQSGADAIGHSASGYEGMDRSPHGTC
jgi:hypothetical protein